jgi:hypothetical protein
MVFSSSHKLNAVLSFMMALGTLDEVLQEDHKPIPGLKEEKVKDMARERG